MQSILTLSARTIHVAHSGVAMRDGGKTKMNRSLLQPVHYGYLVTRARFERAYASLKGM